MLDNFKKPVLDDLAFGRKGTFIRIEKGDLMDGFVNVIWIPFNEILGRESVIQNVPESAIKKVFDIDDPRFPKEGIVYLFAGEHGEAPIMERYIQPGYASALKTIEILQMKLSATEGSKFASEFEATKERQKMMEAEAEISKSSRQVFGSGGDRSPFARKPLGESMDDY